MAFLEKGLLLYLCFAIACSFWQPNIIFGEGNVNMLTTMYNFNENSVTPAVVNNSVGFGDTGLNNPDQMFKSGKEGTSSFQWIVDPLGNIIGFIGMFFKALFSPFTIFMYMINPQVGAPVPIMWIFAVPLIFLVFLGFIIFIRSGFT